MSLFKKAFEYKYAELIAILASWVIVCFASLLDPDLLFSLYFIVIVFFGCIAVLNSILLGKIDAFSPGVIVPLIFMFYALGPLKFSGDYSESTLINYMFAQFLGLTGLKLGLLYGGIGLPALTDGVPSRRIFVKVSKGTDYPLISLNDLLCLRITVFLLLITSLFSVVSEMNSFGGFIKYFSVGYGPERFLISETANSFGGGFAWLGVSGVLLLALARLESRHNGLVRIAGAIVTAFSISAIVIIGGRSTLVYILIFIAVYVHYRVYHFSNSSILIALILGMIFAQIFSHARFYFPEGIWKTISEMVAMTFTHPENFLPWKSGEFHFPARSMLDFLEKGAPPLQYGKTILIALLNSIPFIGRFVNITALNPSEWMMKNFYPDTYAIGGGYGFSPVTEAYTNFGYFGILPMFFIAGFLFALVYKNYVKNKSLQGLLFLMGSAPIMYLDFFRNQLSSSVYKYSRIYLLPWILFVVISFSKSKLSKIKSVRDENMRSL